MIVEPFLLIIDGSSLLTTQFYGNLPREILFAKTLEEKEVHFHKIMKTSKGVYTNAVYGFLRTLFRIMEQQKPTYLAVAWDVSRNTFRRERYAEYKANRSETLVPLKEQFILCQQVLEKLHIAQFMDPHYEADDFSGSLSKKFSKQIPVRILTKDHDYYQLADYDTTIWMMQSDQKKADELLAKYQIDKKTEMVPDKVVPMTPETILLETGVTPDEIPALKGLQGDSADNIKGVKGVGPDTAALLIHRYHNVDGLYEAIHAAAADNGKALSAYWKNDLGIKRNPLGALTKESETELVGERAARLSEELASIHCDLPIAQKLEDLAITLQQQSVMQVLHELEINSISTAFLTEKTQQVKQTEVQEIDSLLAWEETIPVLEKSTAAFGIWQDEAQGKWYVSAEETVYVFSPEGFLTEACIMDQLAAFAQKHIVYLFDIKSMMNLFQEPLDTIRDVSLMDYLLRPLTAEHAPEAISLEWYAGEKVPEGGAELAAFAKCAGELLQKKLEEAEMETLFRDIEMPLAYVLHDMEMTGICADRAQLAEFAEQLQSSCQKEEETIYELAGCRFNINSPKQLGEVLFEKLMLPYEKKKKTGYSTNADLLEKLKDDYPIVEHVLNYRQYAKLRSTYAEGLAVCIAEDGRIHTTFQQMVTATGRLSSTNPNLQNIPIRTELGRLIRKVFVPKEGCIFLDADYSQIELRLTAHMSGDEALIRAYNEQADIHRLTASQVFNVPFSEVTSAQRSAAKAVNFGLLYGISSFSLGKDLGITKKMAEEYMKNYFARFPRVKAYLQGLVTEARNTGMVRTLYGRIRPIPEISSANFMQRSFGERVAMNSPIQGTAADIMKLAMISVHQELKKQGLKAKILLQVHDELLLEVPLAEEEQVRTLLKQCMEQVVSLKVPLEVDVNSGMNWYSAK